MATIANFTIAKELRAVVLRHRYFWCFFIVYCCFFLYTLADYGLIWDTFAEYPRAAAYVDHFVSSRSTPDEIPVGERFPWSTLSYAEAKASNTQSANGCMASWVAALFGKIFYQNLHWLGPVDSYHLGLSALWFTGLGLFYLYLTKVSNRATALVATALLSLSPRMFADAHNNMKDLPSCTFGAVALLAWYRGFLTQRYSALLAGGVWFGVSLACKHTSLLLLAPLAAGTCCILIVQRRLPRAGEVLVFALSLFIAVVILFGHLPHLWVEPGEALERVKEIVAIGTRRKVTNPSMNGGPLWLLLSTTPPVALIAAGAGLLGCLIYIKRLSLKMRCLFLLSLAWVFIVIGVWSTGRLVVFDGIRNFQHYWPGLAILAALGWQLQLRLMARALKPVARRINAVATAALLCLPCAAATFVYHPFQNTYFNDFVGGLAGAQEYKKTFQNESFVYEPLDYWGSSLRKCFEWCELQLPAGSRVAFGVGSEVGKYYNVNPRLRSSCTHNDPAVCEKSYIISLERPTWFEACDLYVRKHGKIVFETGMRGVRLAAVFEVPGGWNSCHMEPRLELFNSPIINKQNIELRLTTSPCARGSELNVVIGAPPEAGGVPGVVAHVKSHWVPWADVKSLRADILGPDFSGVPSVVASGTETIIIIPRAALHISGADPGAALHFVVIVGSAGGSRLSNAVRVTMTR
ncbi:MAG: ArnT family glycosyltransferase [Planctomycetota bacterium]